MKPPEFHDTTDPVVANTWIKEMEKAFELVQLGEDQKTVYASYFLKGDVIFWWETVQALEGNRIVTWNRFKELFLEKYFPKYMQTQMELKFLELKQGNMSVLEYEKKFTELSRFVNKYVHTDEEKAQRFQQGLEPWIRSRVSMFEINNYSGVVQKAAIIENDGVQARKNRENKKRKGQFRGPRNEEGSPPKGSVKRIGFHKGGNFQKRNDGNKKQGNKPHNRGQEGGNQPQRVECKHCGKMHLGICNKLNMTCFKCNQKGHLANECKNPKAGVTCFKCGKIGHMARDCKSSGPVKNMMGVATASTAVPT